jgi:hypothetical protein
MRSVGLAEGLRIGLVLGGCVVVLAVVGLAPSFSWVPEVPLLAMAVVLPIAAYALAGSRAVVRARRWSDGLVAGAVAGALSGAIGGVSYVLFGKPLLNIAVGVVLGMLGGALVGSAAATVALRRRP